VSAATALFHPAFPGAAQGPNNSMRDVAGLAVGHFTDPRRLTGCTVILAQNAGINGAIRNGVTAAVDVRGAAPGTRETELLDPTNTVEQVHAVLLTGGSAFGLDAATGVMRWLDEHEIGLETGYGRVPIVPAAVLFDLPVIRQNDSPNVRPDAAAGYAACVDAFNQYSANVPLAQGNIGAGAGATVGKLFGMHRIMKGGIGEASVQVSNWVVAAIVACNAIGDVIDPTTGRVLAGARTANGKQIGDTQSMLLNGEQSGRGLPGTNTTIGVIATNAKLSKAQAKRLAMSAHDGLARAVRPAHTPLDGDTLFALATGTNAEVPDLTLLNAMAAEATARAIVQAIRHAHGIMTLSGWVPSAADLIQSDYHAN
jgi:L-aminopeptidase/D-esterase-like protein